ncbi:MAG TPA: hypothetical protein VGP24_15550 [Glaciihabitans sp.]|jgi:hypothetical protein|nr:hypothetical protein [Glaciihabitans sp.]
MPSRRHTLTLLIASLVVSAPLMAGCSGIPVQSIVEDATGGTVSVGGTEIPDDFPADIPLPDGEVLNAQRVGTGDGKVWNVTVKVTAPTPEQFDLDLKAAGYAASSNVPLLDQTGGTAGYANGRYAIAVVVTDDVEDTYTANVTVSSLPQ